MLNRKPILALIALILLAAQSAATVAFAAPAQVAFDPTQGEQRDYRVGVRVQPEDGGDGSTSRGEWLALQSVMRYRVSADGLMSTTHIEPRFMQAENESGPLFSSARRDDLDNTSIPRLMRDGFDLIVDRDSESMRLANSNREAWQAVSERAACRSASSNNKCSRRRWRSRYRHARARSSRSMAFRACPACD